MADFILQGVRQTRTQVLDLSGKNVRLSSPPTTKACERGANIRRGGTRLLNLPAWKMERKCREEIKVEIDWLKGLSLNKQKENKTTLTFHRVNFNFPAHRYINDIAPRNYIVCFG